MTKLSSSLPKSADRNGLAAIAGTLTVDPQRFHVVVAVVDCQRVTLDADSGVREPTARIRAIEVVPERDEHTAAGLLVRAYEARTGQSGMLWDPHTGELH